MRPPAVRVSLSDLALAAGGGATKDRPALLLVDDDAAMRSALTCYFERCRFEVAAAATLTEAKTLFVSRLHWTLVLADYHLPDGYGLELQSWFAEQPGVTRPPFLLMSGSVDGVLLSRGIDFLPKPFTLAQLDAAVRRLLGGATEASAAASASPGPFT